jgi:hypothetical protein
MSTSLVIIVFNSIKYIFVWKKLGMQPFSINTLLIVLSGGVSLVAGYFVPYLYNPVFDAFVRSCVIIVVYLAMLFWLKPAKDLETYVASIKKNKRLF